jgi:hypothetical protein
MSKKRHHQPREQLEIAGTERPDRVPELDKLADFDGRGSRDPLRGRIRIHSAVGCVTLQRPDMDPPPRRVEMVGSGARGRLRIGRGIRRAGPTVRVQQRPGG